MWKKAQAMARANIIPKSFQNNPANCFVALEMAHRMGASPFEVMQNLNVIHGSPSWSAKYVIARANQSGVFTGPIAFEQSGSGASLSVTAFATVAATGVRAEFTCDMAMAKSEKWDSNPKYKSGLAALMLHYRAATFLVKLTCPEVLLGMQTSEELEDMRAARVVESAPAVASINQKLLASEPAREEPVAEPPSEVESPPARDLDGMFEE